jgi:hypothetical protein
VQLVYQVQKRGKDMNDYFDEIDEVGDDGFVLTEQEGRWGKVNLVRLGMYLVLFVLILVTGVHAILLVMSQTAAPPPGETAGIAGTITNSLRIGFPLIVEAAALLVGVGFIQAMWRKSQKYVGLAIEVVWVVFAMLNMISFFAIERGQQLDSIQSAWVNYGLPISGIIAGALLYGIFRADPDHKRREEAKELAERRTMARFSDQRNVYMSPAMRRVNRQKTWQDIINSLRTAGYTDAQIAFMTGHVPQLRIDRNNNNVPDLLESGPVIDQSGIGGSDGRMSDDEVADFMSTPGAVQRFVEWMNRQGSGNGVNPTRPRSGASGR